MQAFKNIFFVLLGLCIFGFGAGGRIGRATTSMIPDMPSQYMGGGKNESSTQRKKKLDLRFNMPLSLTMSAVSSTHICNLFNY